MARESPLRRAVRMFVQLPDEPARPRQSVQAEPEADPIVPAEAVQALEEVQDLLGDLTPASPPPAPVSRRPHVRTLADLYEVAGVATSGTCPVEEVAALVRNFAGMEPQAARRAAYTALEFRPEADAGQVFMEGRAKLEALEKYALAERVALDRLRNQTIERIRRLESSAEEMILELERRIQEIRAGAEGETVRLRDSFREREEAFLELEPQIQETSAAILATLSVLRDPDHPELLVRPLAPGQAERPFWASRT